MSLIRLLGAEAQAAASFAQAYPERRFEFLTDKVAVDGGDLVNVAIVHAKPDEAANGIALCPRWLPEDKRRHLNLRETFLRLAASGAVPVLPVFDAPQPQGQWQIKGDLFHRPDAPQSGTARSMIVANDPHGCGLVYQPWLSVRGIFLAVGCRSRQGTTLGLFEVLAERFFRIDIIQAARTVDRKDLMEYSLAALSALAYEGFFSLNWLDTEEGIQLSSFRPVPKAGVGTLRRAGADLLAVPRGTRVARPGECFVAHPHYSSYGRIGL